ncbi:alpha/beta hydrolase [Salinarchaeum sp. IM2453]|uniref:alpha/beta fold hydrolase n=1 Tax=Salinarchaeum sp. IM2453 TaxID=2862870 RepID=UPI001C83DCAE|nr:alpha/beta hydrolase [Salinarchaeum sp. IM2453]QZA87677.1 alpha/beta hydrolase [Salinarchaeum sp. IM2453]
METITQYEREIAYRFHEGNGAGLTVLFVHGSGGTHTVWKQQFQLRADWSVAAIDLSGHGCSEDITADPGFETLSAYADDITAVAKEVNANVLVGCSLGGAVILHLLAERDTDITAAVISGTGPRMPVLNSVREWLETDFDRAIEFLDQPGGLFSKAGTKRAEQAKQLMKQTGQEVTWRDFETCHQFDIRDRVDQIQIPIQLVAGENDKLTPPAEHEKLQKLLPEAELDIIPDAGHLVMLEQPEAVNSSISAFLQKIASE